MHCINVREEIIIINKIKYIKLIIMQCANNNGGCNLLDIIILLTLKHTHTFARNEYVQL
jgi:hypothetical protein